MLCSHTEQDISRRDKCNRTLHDLATDDCKDLLENLGKGLPVSSSQTDILTSIRTTVFLHLVFGSLASEELDDQFNIASQW